MLGWTIPVCVGLAGSRADPTAYLIRLLTVTDVNGEALPLVGRSFGVSATQIECHGDRRYEPDLIDRVADSPAIARCVGPAWAHSGTGRFSLAREFARVRTSVGAC